MIDNPFTPSFGGKPDFFFGRKAILARFDKALNNRGSADRVLFITGNRGCGKTALLEQFSRKATANGWKTIDLNSENALGSLTRHLVRHSAATKTIAPEIDVSFLGSGANVGGVSSSKTTAYAKDDLDLIFLESCESNKSGIFVSIDEIQKIDPTDLSSICNAFQMASRKGFDVILVAAGLPYSYENIIQYEGCTFMRRAVHERLSVFSPSEAREAVEEAFSHVDGLSLDAEAATLLVEASYGHPYFMQLAGYHIVEYANESTVKQCDIMHADDIRSIIPTAIAEYEERSLVPILSALPPAEKSYLESMAQTVNDQHIAKTHDVAAFLGKTTSQTSISRQSLLRKGIIVSVGRGEVMFNIPYLRTFLSERAHANPEPILAREWGF